VPDGRFYSTVLCMPPLCSSVCLRILSLARCRGGRLSCRRVCAPPPSGVPGRPPSPPPPCAHVIGLRGRRRGAPSLTAARGFARRCQRICVAGQDSPPEYNCSTVRYLRIANGRRGACCRFELLWLDLRCPVPPRLTSRGLIAILPWRCGPMHNPVHHLRPCCCQLVRAGLNSQARVHPRVHARALRPMDAYVTRVSSSRAAEPEPAAAPEGCSSRAAEPAVAPTAAPAAAPARAAPVAAAAGAAVVPAAAPAAAPAAPTVVHAAAAEVPQPAGASKKWVEFAKNYAESREKTEIVHETREGRHPFQPPSAEAVLLNLQDQSSRRELFRQPEHPLPTLHLVPTSASPQLPHHLYRRRARGEARVNSLTTYTEAGLVGKFINVRLLHLSSHTASPPPIQKTGSWGSR
jgi:hypothetical protein